MLDMLIAGKLLNWVLSYPAARIERLSQAEPVFAQARDWAWREALRFPNLELRFDLRSRWQLAYLNANPNLLGLTIRETKTFCGAVVGQSVRRVAILRGLPESTFRNVLVHELGHAWITAQQIPPLPLWQEEGFCELLAHRHLSWVGGLDDMRQARAIEARNDPVYGLGLHRAKMVLDRNGWPGFLKLMHSPWHKSMPTR